MPDVKNRARLYMNSWRTIGIGADEIDTIIFTHLHWDHCYNVKQFSQGQAGG